MTRTFACCVLILLVAMPAAEAAVVLRYSKPVEFAAIDDEELVAVALDSDVYAATGDGLPDLRIIDDRGAEVAFTPRLAAAKQTRTARQTWYVDNPVVRSLEGDALEIEFSLDSSARAAPRGIRLRSPLDDFEHQVQVFGSADGENWEPLVDDALIFDYSRFIDARNDIIELPENDYRQFRLRIENITDEQQSQLMKLTRRIEDGDEASRSEQTTIDRRPFRIDRIELWTETTRNDATGTRQQGYPVEKFIVAQDETTGETLVTVETRREPLTALTIETPDRNFSRRAVVEIERQRDGRSAWRPIAAGQLAHLDFRTLQRSDLTLEFSETRQARYRIVIDNRDSPPLAVTGVKARGHLYELVFMATPGRTYTLAYGNPTVENPAYDTAVLSATLAEGFQPVAATLGEQSAGKPLPQPAASRLSQLLEDGRFVVAAIAALALLLGFALYRAAQRLEKQPDAPLQPRPPAGGAPPEP